MKAAFGAYGLPLTNMASFKYLICILMAMYNNCPEVVAYLSKARKKWVRMSIILCQKGTNVRMSGNLFKEVVQALIILGLETWVAIPHVRRTLGGFHHMVDLRMMGKKLRRSPDGV